MRILHIITPSRLSGAELLVLRMSSAMVRKGHEVSVLSKPIKSFMEAADRHSVQVSGARIGGKGSAVACARMVREVRRLAPDVVLAHLSTAAFWGSLAARWCRTPCIGYVHATAHAVWYRRCPALVCVSEAVAADLRRQGVGSARLHVVRNGLDPGPFVRSSASRVYSADRAVTVGTVAHLSRKKGFDVLLAVAEALPSLRFAVVGEGPLRGELEAWSRSRLDGRLDVMGWRADVAEAMQAFDVFALLSRQEGLPLVILEAMASGLPVVATRISGIPEVVADGETGLLVDPGDVGEGAAAIQRLAGSPEMRESLGRAGRERVLKRFTLDEMVRRLDEVMQAEVVSQR